jgi:hypothetical protein
MGLLERLQADHGTALVVITHEAEIAGRAHRRIVLRDGPRRSSRRPAGEMTGREAFRVAMQALVANRLRSALTTLGVVIGVLSVVLLVAIGQGARQEITGAIEGLGSNLLFVLPGDGDFGSGPAAAGSPSTTSTASTASSAGPDRTAGYVVGGETVQARGGPRRGHRLRRHRRLPRRHGTGGRPRPAVHRLRRGRRPPGRAARGDDRRRAVPRQRPDRPRAVDRRDPVPGRRGAHPRRGTAFGPDRDRQVLVPVSTGQRLFGTDRLDAIFVRADATATIDRDRACRAGARGAARRPSSPCSARTRSSGWSATSCRSSPWSSPRSRDLAAGRRRRRVQHHAGVGQRTDARDRAAQGPRRPDPRHHPPVPARGGVLTGHRRAGRARARGRVSPRWSPRSRRSRPR